MKHVGSWLIAVVMMFFPLAACADVLTLPAQTQRIAARAFANCAALTEVVLPDTLTEIGAEAFSNTGLTQINLPESVQSIADDAFAGCPALVAQVVRGSYAEAYCQQHGIDMTVMAETPVKYRALLIGESAYATNPLKAPPNDAQGVANMLTLMTATLYKTHLHLNQSKADILALIESTFADANENDVSLFYYAGHGRFSGELLCVDGVTLTPGELRTALDKVPGIKIVLVDACYSGGLISRSAGNPTDAFTGNFLAGFIGALMAHSANDLADAGYYVITACKSDELSYEIAYYPPYGLFSYWLNYGAGWEQRKQQQLPLYADTNQDGCISLSEAANYTRDHITEYLDDYNLTYNANIVSTVQSYPAGSGQVLFAR